MEPDKKDMKMFSTGYAGWVAKPIGNRLPGMRHEMLTNVWDCLENDVSLVGSTITKERVIIGRVG